MSSADPTQGLRENVLPGWVTDLRVLAPVAASLAALVSNPKQWLEDTVRTIIAEWIVGSILDAWTFVLGWVIYAFDQTVSVLLTAVPILEGPFQMGAEAWDSVIELLFGAARDVAREAGLAGPPATALVFVLVGTVTLAVIVGTWKVIPGSDFVEGATGVFKK